MKVIQIVTALSPFGQMLYVLTDTGRIFAREENMAIKEKWIEVKPPTDEDINSNGW